MTTLVKATLNDVELLTNLGKKTFLEAHGMSAPKKDIDNYVHTKFSQEVFETDLNDSKNHYTILYHHQKPVGYSKIIFNCTHPNIFIDQVTKLERLYLLQEFHNLKLGLQLFNFNLQESISNHQAGMWLFVWVENQKAIDFYKRAGFKIIGNHDFKISETHSNPNHHMLLTY
ncbi:MAG: GNAT family N-acetyltransferase [Flavobacteriales bacterium]|nr:GNAT family N-acetyltransferase [Flavobacteriia bacterium]NCP06400.1 GNAT family N-acetyltransferase [Flavobacteriales bacterium]PIV94916.1 MAG: GNAT family N-acetyltransferase [Flavobacteriaceae bacterium CG17_big_fil_post_rev_8_21_14_2_50_33_15]PIY09548.1 MAG: GNAT family N-acetyltransferase [Flavobacteriaceae bacterium CG_4_10_14_3_um_filter_33_47]PJB17499.1 MAG: GNAT family N-acetyltransferase [Flavobacteriaceae bacterium CG_4_9_14_3_um_filter_33_16]